MLRVDPEPFTLRELWWMVQGRDKHEWNKLSVVCATMYNASGYVKSMVSPSEFNPYASGGSGKTNAGGTKGTKSIPLKMFSKHLCKCAVCGHVGNKCTCKKQPKEPNDD